MEPDLRQRDGGDCLGDAWPWIHCCTSSARKRRSRPPSRTEGSTPQAAHRRTVSGRTASTAATSRSVSNGCRLPGPALDGAARERRSWDTVTSVAAGVRLPDRLAGAVAGAVARGSRRPRLELPAASQAPQGRSRGELRACSRRSLEGGLGVAQPARVGTRTSTQSATGRAVLHGERIVCARASPGHDVAVAAAPRTRLFRHATIPGSRSVRIMS